MAIALTVAGSDPSGGAGIQADLKTFHRFGVYGTAAVTLITVQNTARLSRIEVLPGDLVRDQIQAVLDDLPPGAVKTGALGSEEVVRAVAECRFNCPLVVDPVMFSSGGAPLLDPAGRDALRKLLLPIAALVTPNLAEAAELAAREVRTPADMRDAARRIADTGARAVLIKGGHLEGEALDVLLSGGVFSEFRTARIETRHTHGTGCAYSAAITALLARGLSLTDAVGQAKAFVFEAIRQAPGIGAGAGPLNYQAVAQDVPPGSV
jgi:hydroxymethylpyrimidine/phosphomethylpyrimidine kinase